MNKIDRRPAAIIFSPAHFLAFNLVEQLLAQHCVVWVFSSQATAWAAAMKQLFENENFKIYDFKSKFPPRADYIFYLEGFTDSPSPSSKIFSYLKRIQGRFFLVLPFLNGTDAATKVKKQVYQEFKGSGLEGNVVWLGELFGPRMSFDQPGAVAQVLGKTIRKQTVDLPDPQTVIYPLYVGAATQELLRAMLSWGFPQKEVVLATKATVGWLVQKLRVIKPQKSFLYSRARFKTETVISQGSLLAAEIENKDLKKTIEWFVDKQELIQLPQTTDLGQSELFQAPRIIPKPPRKKLLNLKALKVKIKMPKLIPKIQAGNWARGAVLLSFLVLFLSLPYLTLLTSGFCLRWAYQTFRKGQPGRANTLLKTSAALARVVKATPFVLASARTAAFDLEKAAQTGERGLVIAGLSQEIMTGVLGTQQYDLVALSEKLSLELEAFYAESSFLESEIRDLGFLGEKINSQLAQASRWRQSVQPLSELTRRLPELLSGPGQRTYLLLLQNNMELRPTGGFIGSFALVTFAQGQLIDLNVYDVYSADGQLKGYIEPPDPIKNYLGEATWYLRDSNWDPDFVTSAQRAEWFLDKEIDRSVDGVAAIDLELIRSLLQKTGPLWLSDYGMEINDQNLFERVQYEVEANFFPGSRKKANFLTALSSALLTHLTQKDQNQARLIATSEALLSALEERHLQIFLHDSDAANALDELNWDGRVEETSCTGNCQASWFGVVEANLGVNKVNYFIQRAFQANLGVTPDQINYRLTVNFKNNAPPNLDLAGHYKNYLRVLLPAGAEVGDVQIIGTETKILVPETRRVAGRQEVGILVELPAQAAQSVTFNWRIKTKLDLDSPGRIKLLWRKQAGTGTDPVELKVNFPSQVEARSQTGYNKDLSRDILFETNW